MGKKEDIFAAGHELFSKSGYKNVSVSDITKIAGISVGSFYNYYDSKEALFFEIHHTENKKRKEMLVKSLDLSAKPAEIAQQFISLNMKAVSNNLILAEWYGNTIGKELRDQFQNDQTIRNFLGKLLEQWHAENKLRKDISDSEILAIFDALVYLDIHFEDTMPAGSQKTIQWLVKFAALGITKN